MGIIPPIDPQPGSGLPVSGAKEGDAPAQQPYPSNIAVNEAMNEGIAYVNRKVGFTANSRVSVPITATTVNGEQMMDINSFLAPAFNTNEIRRLTFTDSSGIPHPVYPKHYYELDRSYYPIESTPPSVPRWWYVEGYNLFLVPGTSTTGTLNMKIGTSIDGMESDAEIILYLPVDFHVTIQDYAVLELSGRQTQDEEANGRVQFYGAKVAGGLPDIEAWKWRLALQYQPTIAYGSNRRGSGLRPHSRR